MRRYFRGFAFAFCLCFAGQAFAAGQDEAQVLHLLNRITYGPNAFSQDEVRRVGLGAYIEQQLHPERIVPYDALERTLAQLSTFRQPLSSIAETYIPDQEKDLLPEQKKALRERARIIGDEAREAKLLRAIYSPAQLQELMVDFWFNHFNVFEDKGPVHVLVGGYERDAIRPYAMGRFRDLLVATAKHPAMLVYLDNWLNTDPTSRFAHGKFNGLNENYAREIMELHTLGVDGGYSQEDVTTLARILTGWGLGTGKDKSKAQKFAEFSFDARRHDFSDKRFLGHVIRGSGEQEVEEAIDILARHPSTARHISYKIAQFFVADDPPTSLVDAMAKTFTATNGDIRSVLSTMIYSKEFWKPQYAQNKFKPPLRFVVSAIRLSGVSANDFSALQKSLKSMGEPLYQFLTPDGYPPLNERWLNSDALLRRIDFARQLTQGKFNRAVAGGGKEMEGPSVESMMRVLNALWSSQTRAAIMSGDSRLKPALILSSPEFLYY